MMNLSPHERGGPVTALTNIDSRLRGNDYLCGDTIKNIDRGFAHLVAID